MLLFTDYEHTIIMNKCQEGLQPNCRDSVTIMFPPEKLQQTEAYGKDWARKTITRDSDLRHHRFLSVFFPVSPSIFRRDNRIKLVYRLVEVKGAEFMFVNRESEIHQPCPDGQ